MLPVRPSIKIRLHETKPRATYGDRIKRGALIASVEVRILLSVSLKY